MPRRQLAGYRIQGHTPGNARVGAFNAGLLGYFSNRSVVNLDGTVNADAYEAQREGWLMDYVVSKRIDHLVDWRGTLPLARCHESADAVCRRVAVVGERLPGFAGAPIHVLEITPRSSRRSGADRPALAQPGQQDLVAQHVDGVRVRVTHECP